jgi:polyphosphate kinase
VSNSPTPTGPQGGPTAEARRPLDLHDPRLFLNRELSWLEFNQRVLDEAADRTLPALERLRFLGIVASNLDEFFMVRVAGLKQQIASSVLDTASDGMTPQEQLRAVSERVHRMIGDQYRLWREELRPALEAEEGIRLLTTRDLGAEQRARAKEYFRHKVVPVLTPLANDRSHPFPQLRNKSITLAVHLPRPAERRRKRSGGAMAVVGMPAALQRLVPIGDRAYLLLEDLVAEHVGELFPGNPEVKTAAFRVTRNWDIEVDEEEGDDLAASILARVRERDRGAAVRLELAGGGYRALTAPLADQLGVDPVDVYEVDGPLQLQDLAALAGGAADERRAKPAPEPRAVAEAESMFEVIARGDVLLHHPYESFDPVVRFIEEAAEDPDVKAVKQVLYRTGKDSPFIRALLRAAENGKEVLAFLEIKARLDEKNNMRWIEPLTSAGAMIVYGYDGCKTHCKISLVTRQEGEDFRHYVHIGTGNYNPMTARQYTDVSLLTARRDVAEEVHAVFNMLTANSTANDLRAGGSSGAPWPWRRLTVAPHGLKERLLDLVGEEAEHARAGRPARIAAKMNSLVDAAVIRALYAASQAGVQVDLLVRGICCLRPGVRGVSERIRVHQVVDRHLEHSRIFVFGDGKRAKVFISSADWMPRNFHSRVEVMVPVDDPTARARLVEIVETGLADDAKGSALRPDGTYERLRPAVGVPPLRSQDALDPLRRAQDEQLHAVPATR